MTVCINFEPSKDGNRHIIVLGTGALPSHFIRCCRGQKKRQGENQEKLNHLSFHGQIVYQTILEQILYVPAQLNIHLIHMKEQSGSISTQQTWIISMIERDRLRTSHQE
jgi:hypothetical protein